MTRLLTSAGNASAATSLTIAFARLADVMVDISLLNKNGQPKLPVYCAAFLRGSAGPFIPGPKRLLPLVLTTTAQPFIRPFGRSREVADVLLGPPQTLRRETRHFLANPLQLVLTHARFDLVDIHDGLGVRNGVARCGMHPASARDTGRQQFRIFFDELSQIFVHRLLILGVASDQSPVFAPDDVVLHRS